MKKTKLSKDLTQLIVILVIVYLFIIGATTLFIQGFYVDIKFNHLQTFYKQNQSSMTEEQLINYAEQQGFTHTVQTVESFEQDAWDALIAQNSDLALYSQYLNALNQLVGRFNSNEDSNNSFEANFDSHTKMRSAIFISRNDNIIILSLNSAITNDIVYITAGIAIFTSLLFLIIIVCINFFITFRVGKPLDKISKYIDNIASLNKPEELSFSYDDEISKIANALVSMEGELNHEIINRNELLRAITHELKTPLAHITTLMFLYKNEVEEYSDFEYVEQQIQNIISENNELIQITLNSLENTDELVKIINISDLIEARIKTLDVYLNDKQVTVNLSQLILHANPVPINLIMNNLLLNAAKYCNSYLSISNDESTIIIENDYTDNAGQGVGKTIISRLSEFEQYTIVTSQEDGKYLTCIDLTSKLCEDPECPLH